MTIHGESTLIQRKYDDVDSTATNIKRINPIFANKCLLFHSFQGSFCRIRVNNDCIAQAQVLFHQQFYLVT